jgi:hypothetical protein
LPVATYRASVEGCSPSLLATTRVEKTFIRL